MDKSFIDNLHETVVNHLTDENFGACNFASLLDLSTSQTLRKVKVTTGKSANQCIREVKLEESEKLIKETEFTSAEIAKELGVSYILEASVQKDNNEVRISTQLIDAKNDKHIWATDALEDKYGLQ